MAGFSGSGTGRDRFPGFSGRDLKKNLPWSPLQFFSKIFEKNIKGDQGDFFQFFQKLIKKITLLSARDFFCTAGYLKKFNPFFIPLKIHFRGIKT